MPIALVALAAAVAAGGWMVNSGGHTTHNAAPPPRAAASGSADAPSDGPVAAGTFADGACQRLAPTGTDRHRTVFLDAGHGGLDPGGVGVTEDGRTIHEAALTLPVERDVANLLRAQGFTVVVSRTGDTNVARLGPQDVSGGVLTLQGVHDDVAARAICANDAHADLLIGIHFNSGASPRNAGGLTAYDTDRPFSAANLRLARLVQTNVLGSMNAHGWQIPDVGAKPDNDLGSHVYANPDSPLAKGAASYHHLLLLGPAKAGYFSTPSEMPGVIIEPLFITDPFEGSIAASAAGQQAIANGIARAVVQYLM